VDTGTGARARAGALFNIRCGVHFLFLAPAANTTEAWGMMVGSCGGVEWSGMVFYLAGTASGRTRGAARVLTAPLSSTEHAQQ